MQNGKIVLTPRHAMSRKFIYALTCFTIPYLLDAAPAVTSNSSDSFTPGSLGYAIWKSSSGDTIDCSAIAGQTILLAPGTAPANTRNDGSLPAIIHDLTILGRGITINGQNTSQAFSVGAGTVTIKDVIVQNTLSQGGKGGASGGGGGTGGGGALYVHTGSNVTVHALSFHNNKAQGGKGGNSSNVLGGGGGGFGGGNSNDGSGFISSGGGGGNSGGGIGGPNPGQNGAFYGGGAGAGSGKGGDSNGHIGGQEPQQEEEVQEMEVMEFYL